MPVRFTCRLIVVNTDSGKVRVKYDYLGNCRRTGGTPIITLEGPSIIEPPTNEMTEEELNRWQFRMNSLGFQLLSKPTPLTSPLIEASKTIEDEIPKGSVEWKFICARVEGEMLIGVELLNKWKQHVPNISIVSVWAAQTPQPMDPTKSGIVAMMLGGSESLFRRETDLGRTLLAPKMPVMFVSDPQATRNMQSRAAVLSPEYHWLALCTDGYEFDRIPGKAVAEFFDAWMQASPDVS